VAQDGSAGKFCADEVSKNLISRGRGAEEINAAAAIGATIAVVGNEVSRTRHSAPNHIVRRTGKVHAVLRVAQGLSARDAGANKIALNDIGRAVGQVNAQLPIGAE